MKDREWTRASKYVVRKGEARGEKERKKEKARERWEDYQSAVIEKDACVWNVSDNYPGLGSIPVLKGIWVGNNPRVLILIESFGYSQCPRVSVHDFASIALKTTKIKPAWNNEL